MERLYAGRCDASVLTQCTRGNYHECLSALPTHTCTPAANEKNVHQLTMLEDTTCGDGVTCSALLDKQTSTIRLAQPLLDQQGANQILVSSKSVIESVCYSQGLDEYWMRKRQEDADFWGNLGIAPPQAYYGAHTGAFRIFPGRQYEDCGTYDPRTRPW